MVEFPCCVPGGADPRLRTSKISFLPFHRFSLAITSLRVTLFGFPLPSSISNLIYSFPLLGDLSVASPRSVYRADHPSGRAVTAQPLSLPAFAGSLVISALRKMDAIPSPLLSLSGGAFLQELKLTLACVGRGSVCRRIGEGVSSTLESLEIDCRIICASVPTHICIDG